LFVIFETDYKTCIFFLNNIRYKLFREQHLIHFKLIFKIEPTCFCFAFRAAADTGKTTGVDFCAFLEQKIV
jgi:hypothetical protein